MLSLTLGPEQGPEAVLTDASPRPYRRAPLESGPLHGPNAGSYCELIDALREPDTAYRLIGPDKKSAGTVNKRQEAFTAVRDGRAASFAIRLRDGLVCADVDLDDAAGVAAKDALVSWLTTNNWPHVVATSGRPGHFHVYARLRYTADPQFARATKSALLHFERACKSAGITSQVRHGQALVRPPGSPHPVLPVEATLVEPVSPFNAIVRLGLVGANTTHGDNKDTKKSKKKPAKRSTRKVKVEPSRHLHLLKPAYQLLASRGIGRDDLLHADGSLDGSKALSALAWHAAWQGLTLTQWLDVALNPAHIGCVKAHDRGDDGKYAKESFERGQKARNEARTNWTGRPVNPNLETDLAAFLTDMTHAAWSAKGRPAIIAVAETLSAISRLAGTLEGFGASVRLIGDLTAMPADRVNGALRAMRETGAIKVTQHYGADGVGAHRWALRPVPRLRGGCSSDCRDSNHPSPVAHDIFTAAGLDKAGWLLHRALTTTPQSVEEIVLAVTHLTETADVTRQRKRTVQAQLNEQVEVGLAKQDKNGSWVLGHAVMDTDRALAEAAATLNVTGAASAIKAAHLADRARYARGTDRLVRENQMSPENTPDARDSALTHQMDWDDFDAQRDAWEANGVHEPIEQPPTADDVAYAESMFPVGLTHDQANRAARSMDGDFEAIQGINGDWTVAEIVADPDTGEIYEIVLDPADLTVPNLFVAA